MRGVRRITRARRLTGALQAAAAVTALFSLATLADQQHRYLELFAHFRLQYLVAAATLGILLFAVRSRSWAIGMLLIGAVNAAPVLPWYQPGAAVPTGGTTLKLLLANLYSANPHPERLLRLVDAEQPDLIFLQEMTGHAAHALSPLQERYPFGTTIARDDNFGIAVFSRSDIRVRSPASPPFGFPTLVVEQVIDGRTVTLVSTHPMPPLGATRYESRNRQLAHAAALLNQAAGPRLLIGDLNTTMWGEHYRQLVDATGLQDAREGFGVLPSWPQPWRPAMIPIDHCLVSPEFAVADLRTGPDIGSDHLPLIAELVLRPE
jgi:endonuclease/exonuclease/phosphatase (EEP) superfamily protein YafD